MSGCEEGWWVEHLLSAARARQQHMKLGRYSGSGGHRAQLFRECIQQRRATLSSTWCPTGGQISSWDLQQGGRRQGRRGGGAWVLQGEGTQAGHSSIWACSLHAMGGWPPSSSKSRQTNKQSGELAASTAVQHTPPGEAAVAAAATLGTCSNSAALAHCVCVCEDYLLPPSFCYPVRLLLPPTPSYVHDKD